MASNQAISDPIQAARELKRLFDEHDHAVFFGGAGVSTASGIPDFRSVDGLYHQQFAYPPETMLSHSFYVSHPAEFFDFYRKKMIALGAKPNRAHTKLVELEAAGKLDAVVTQNIDGLHQMAGSKKVWELHGSVHRNICQRCGAVYDAEWICAREHEDERGIPLCPECGGRIKPDVVLYEESLDQRVLMGAVESIAAYEGAGRNTRLEGAVLEADTRAETLRIRLSDGGSLTADVSRAGFLTADGGTTSLRRLEEDDRVQLFGDYSGNRFVATLVILL